MAAELSTNFERMRDEVITGVHAIAEGKSEAPPLKVVKEEPATMNTTMELNSHILKLIEYLQQEVVNLATTNNRPNPPNPHNTSSSLNDRNCHYCNTGYYCCLHGYCSHTSMD